jgi:hypothetical protein
MPKPAEMVNFSTTLAKPAKELLERFCKKRGLRRNHLVESAIVELSEDEMDKEIIEERELEETIDGRSVPKTHYKTLFQKSAYGECQTLPKAVKSMVDRVDIYRESGCWLSCC